MELAVFVFWNREVGKKSPKINMANLIVYWLNVQEE